MSVIKENNSLQMLLSNIFLHTDSAKGSSQLYPNISYIPNNEANEFSNVFINEKNVINFED